MSDIYVTLSGNVTDDPRQYQFRDGSRATSMRMAVDRRVLDPRTNTWQTRDTTYYTIRCYRGLADNVHQSVRKGHPVVVHGKLRIKQFERDGQTRFWAEIEATSVGHDLKWGISSFEKPMRAYNGIAPSDEDRRRMEDATREWEMTRMPRSIEELRGLGDGSGRPSSDGTGFGGGDGEAVAGDDDFTTQGDARAKGRSAAGGDAGTAREPSGEPIAEMSGETAEDVARDVAGDVAGDAVGETRDDGAWLSGAMAA